MCISGVVQIYTSSVNMELYLLDRAVPRALPPFRHSLGTQLSEDYILTSYADTLLKIYKINDMDYFFFLWGPDALFSSRREIETFNSEESEGHRSWLLAQKSWE